jgi:hypothetical protein
MIRFLFGALFINVCVSLFSQEEAYRLRIESAAAFKEFAGAPLTHTFAGVSAVKIVYFIGEKKLYFINSKKYPLHYNFCKEMFGDIELFDFNRANYSDNPSRNYILATLNYFKDTDLYTLEFSPADNIGFQPVEELYYMVRGNFFTEKLFLQLNNPSFLANTRWQVPTICVDKLFGGQKLQIIQKGSVTGKLLWVDADSLKALPDVSKCILLLRGNSNDIPLCRGIITTSFQTPLSHISILAQNRKTPVVALRQDDIHSAVSQYLNKTVTLDVLEDTFLLKESWGVDKEDGLRRVIKLSFDTVNRFLLPLRKLRVKDVCSYGVKAINLAQLQRIRYKGKRILTPEGAFAIPMYYYWEHLKTNGIDTTVRNFLKEYSRLSPAETRARLFEIRTAIERSKMDKQLYEIVKKLVEDSGTSEQYRFRSSSNAEDLPGFNGAGLYTSATGKHKGIEKAIKKVWASLWSDRAFEERCYAGINHTTVGMAVLAHRSFPEEYANGVAITRNLYRDFDFGFVVNLQVGDHSLVKPVGEQTCEQFLTFFNTADPFFNEKDAVEYISFSSLNNYKPILTRQEIFELTQQLDKIKKRFYRKLGAWRKVPYKDFAMDVEFKAEMVKGKKVFYFKQARPF